MSPLVARPGRNATRQAKKLKEIRKVKGAILWHAKARKERQKIQQERWESRQSVVQRVKWENEFVKGAKKTALKNALEDWRMGPLRPNRSVGANRDTYGALTAEQMQKPDIPVRTQKNRNESRVKKGLEPSYPLIVDDQRYFPIVRGDRVLMLKGRDKGKIGEVIEIVPRTHEAIIKGMNMQYYDASIFNADDGQTGPRRENEVPLPMDDIRLVVPYEITDRESRQKVYKDVIVDKVFMERHTTGIDPFTLTDYGSATIPEKHQYDPISGLPIFHRYIAGTRHRIEWPWELEEEIADSGLTPEDATDKQTWFRKTISTLRHPITSLKSWRTKGENTKRAATAEEAPVLAQLEQIEAEQLERMKNTRPRSHDPQRPEAYENVDTTRNIVEAPDSMAYTLLAPPFPDTLGAELRLDIHDFAIEASKTAKKDGEEGFRLTKKPKRAVGQQVEAVAALKAKRRAAERMKTPMQLRWEMEHAKKTNEKPLVDTETLLLALGQHMQKNGVKVKRKAAANAEDVD